MSAFQSTAVTTFFIAAEEGFLLEEADHAGHCKAPTRSRFPVLGGNIELATTVSVILSGRFAKRGGAAKR